MNITDISIKLSDEAIGAIEENRDPLKETGLLAYCTMVVDSEFVINDMKVINGYKGVFIAMPNRKITIRLKCGHKNPIDVNYCSNCGKKTNLNSSGDDDDATRKYVDIAHPISASCRQLIHNKIMEAFEKELKTHSSR